MNPMGPDFSKRIGKQASDEKYWKFSIRLGLIHGHGLAETFSNGLIDKQALNYGGLSNCTGPSAWAGAFISLMGKS